MKSFFFLSAFLMAVGTGCAKSGGSGNGQSPPPEVKTQSLDGSVWLIVGKFCDGQIIPVSEVDKVQFDNGFFAQMNKGREDKDMVCVEARIFARTLERFDSQDGYNETSSLTARQKRIVCRSKLNESKISDDTVAFSAPDAMLSVSISGGAGTAEIKNSTECMNNVLRLFLKRK